MLFWFRVWLVMKIQEFVKGVRLPQNECEAYFREKRIESFKTNGIKLKFFKAHALANRILTPLLKIQMRATKHRLIIVEDKRRKTNKPIIFCPTHIGGVDIEMSIIAINAPCWVLIGDPRELYKTFDGLLLKMNGVVFFDLPYKEDRVVAKETMRAVLNNGRNLFMFPEGTQNISINALVGRLYAGAVDLAISCNAEIVPIVFCRDEKNYYCSIGENISYENCSYEDRFILTNELRDKIATQKWEIIEKLPVTNRKKLPDNTYEDFIDGVLALNAEYTISPESIKHDRFIPKDIAEPEDVFSFMDKLVPSKANAFLLRDRNINKGSC